MVMKTTLTKARKKWTSTAVLRINQDTRKVLLLKEEDAYGSKSFSILRIMTMLLDEMHLCT